MNFITVSAKAVDKPQVLKNSRIPCTVCNVEIPAPNYTDKRTGEIVNRKGFANVYANLKIWGPNSGLLSSAPQGQHMLIIDGELLIKYNKETQTNEIEIKAKAIAPYQESWTPVNNVILSGRTALDFDPNDSKQRNYRATQSGWVFAEQRIAVQNRDIPALPDIYMFKTAYDTNAEFRGTNWANLIANHLHKKQIPLSIKGSLITEISEIEGQDPRYYTKILLAKKNAILVHSLKPVESQTVKPQESKPQAPSTVMTEDAWNDLPSLAPDPTPTPPVNPTPIAIATPNTDNEPF